MTDKKLTTESIVQGLDGADVLLRDLAGSTHTSLNEYDIGVLFNIAYLCGDAADFINRQKAEIENYSHNNRTMTNSIYKMQKIIESQKAEIERLEKQLIFEIETAYDRGRKTASKEFAERLEDKLGNTDLAIHFVDNLVKEMVGDTG